VRIEYILGMFEIDGGSVRVILHFVIGESLLELLYYWVASVFAE